MKLAECVCVRVCVRERKEKEGEGTDERVCVSAFVLPCVRAQI